MSPAALPTWTTVTDLPRAHGAPLGSGRLRVTPEDFHVTEQLGFTPDGTGDHRLLWVRKTGANTEWVARRLAATAGVPISTVGYAGLKDRWAVTEQWFSLPAPQREAAEPDWSALTDAGIEVLAVHAHRRKLKRGTLAGNHFHITIRDWHGDPAALTARLDAIRAHGVPNYFGEQRFGHADSNLHHAHAFLTGAIKRPPPHQRGLWISAARSQLFNELLAERVRRGDWKHLQPGDCAQLAGRQSFFCAEDIDATLNERVAHWDLHPTGPLWGRGTLPTRQAIQTLEQQTAAHLDPWPERLAAFGLEHERRALRLRVEQLEAECSEERLTLHFALTAGSYATSVLRELLTAHE